MSAATIDLLYRMADDALIIGHRNSEWTGIGPMLEEDLAFSSMAQDKIGHALALYTILHHQFGEAHPDKLGFLREEKDYCCCHFVEFPIGEYDFTLMRHFLFDNAELLRYEALSKSSLEPLAQLAKKVKGEVKYHVMHADAFLRQLMHGTEESKARMQTALNECWPLAFSIFETGVDEESLIRSGVFSGETILQEQWLSVITTKLQSAGLAIPVLSEEKIPYGGRKGFHSVYLRPLIKEMSEVVHLDPTAEW